MNDQLLKSKLDRDIVGLLAVSKIPDLEKEVWITTLPFMNEKDKKELKENLEKEIEYEMMVAADANVKFLKALENGI